MTTACANVSIKYNGDGIQKVFSFPFTYLSWSDVEAFLYDETNQIWVNQQNKFIRDTATTLEFLTAPPASSTDNILIARNTDLESMIATYYPGSSIRAQDLNDDFDQLRFAIEESRCDLETFRSDLGDDFVEKKIPFVPLIGAIVISLFGGLTLYFNNPIFIYMKPTIVNLIFAAITSLPPRSPPSPLFAREVPSSGQVPVGLKNVGPGKSLAGLELV